MVFRGISLCRVTQPADQHSHTYTRRAEGVGLYLEKAEEEVTTVSSILLVVSRQMGESVNTGWLDHACYVTLWKGEDEVMATL